MAGNTACSDGSFVVLHVSARSWSPETNTTVGYPVPRHSMYIWRPTPRSTSPAKSLLLPESGAVAVALGLAVALAVAVAVAVAVGLAVALAVAVGLALAAPPCL